MEHSEMSSCHVHSVTMGKRAAMLMVTLLLYSLGIHFSHHLVPVDTLSNLFLKPPPSSLSLSLPPLSSSSHTLLSLPDKSTNSNVNFGAIELVLHRNGEPEPCTNSSLSFGSLLVRAPTNMYHLDALLTHALLPAGCDLLSFCDGGPSKTPVQPDHSQLVTVPESDTLPCHFHTREGLRLTSLSQLTQLATQAHSDFQQCDSPSSLVDQQCPLSPQLHLYAVPAGRVFLFAPQYIGEIFTLSHVHGPNNLPVSLQVLSLSPRVFDIHNFFTRDESSAIVQKALSETSETHRIKRSSTGATGYNVNSQRTSENGFDTHGKEAQAVKRRSLAVLGFHQYEESYTDGLQVLRYNQTTAYIPHLDWIDDYQQREEHNFDTAGVGSNRFATILLYMSDLTEGDGGETVFTHGWPAHLPEADQVSLPDALSSLRQSGDVAGILKEGSWEERLVAQCRSRLAVRPHSSRAVLFYSQHADGTPDENSKHGGCPVIHGEKWAANLWVWNAPRSGFPGAPLNQHVVEKNRALGKESTTPPQKKASFVNTETNEEVRNAQLYFQDTFWGKLGFGDPALNVNTYEGHEWNVKVGEEVVRKIVINKDSQQMYKI